MGGKIMALTLIQLPRHDAVRPVRPAAAATVAARIAQSSRRQHPSPRMAPEVELAPLAAGHAGNRGIDTRVLGHHGRCWEAAAAATEEQAHRRGHQAVDRGGDNAADVLAARVFLSFYPHDHCDNFVIGHDLSRGCLHKTSTTAMVTDRHAHVIQCAPNTAMQQTDGVRTHSRLDAVVVSHFRSLLFLCVTLCATAEEYRGFKGCKESKSIDYRRFKGCKDSFYCIILASFIDPD